MDVMSDTNTPPTQDNCKDSTDTERVLEVMFIFAEDYSEPFRVSAPPNGSKYAMRREGDGLLFTADSERIEVTNVELRNLWERFQKWKKRGDSAVTLTEFFSDLNRWGKTGEAMIEEVLALLLFAEANQEEIENRLWAFED
ncbi:MAG: hypothetical protein EBR81_11810 [Proteobacteria bacterium]|nr:hypothetical protein [Pseudomonadota bacterium]